MKLELEIPDQLHSIILRDPDQIDFARRVSMRALYRSLDAMSGARSRQQLAEEIEGWVCRFGDDPVDLRERYHCVNVHRMRDFTDEHGLVAGDEMLRALADLLRRNYPGRPIYRAGGDKFVVDLADLATVAPVLPGGPLIKHSTVEFAMKGPVGWMCASELAQTALSLLDEYLHEAAIEGREIKREVSASIQDQ